MRRRLVIGTVLTVLIGALFSAAAVASPAPATAATGNAGSVFTLTNQQRTNAGLRALATDAALDAAAQAWAQHLASTCTFEHSTSSWRSSQTSSAGWVATGENIAAGYSTPSDVVTAWMNSAGHRANILDSRYTGLGVGYAVGPCYGTYWVQIFGIGLPPIPKIGTVSVAGTAAVGGTLRATTTGWSSGVSLAWQWLSDGKAIPGATSTSYTPTIADGGNRIQARVTARLSGYFPANVNSAATAAVTGAPPTDRVWGDSRYGTSAAIATRAFPNGADIAYIASGSTFPDSLSAAPAAAFGSGPLLLTAPDQLPDAVRTSLISLAPHRIVIVGGDGAVSPAVQDQLDAIAPTTRIGGADRYETSRNLVASAFTSAAVVYLATGATFPDALTAGAAAGAQHVPVILVPGGAKAVDSQTLALISQLGATTVRIAGGTGAVSAGIESSLRAKGFTTQRLQGADRYATAVAINKQAFSSADVAFLSSGTTFPDALSGSAAAGALGQPLYTTPSTCLSSAIDKGLTAMDPSRITLLGGTGALTSSVATLSRC